MKTIDTTEAGYLTKQSARTFTSLSVTTLDDYRRSGRLPYHRIGRRVLFARRDLVALIESGRVDAGTGGTA